MKRKWLTMAVTVTLIAALIAPVSVSALTEAEIDRELANIKKSQDQAAASKKSAEAKKKDLANQKVQEARNIKDLMSQINDQGAKLAVLNGDIADTTVVLKDAGKQLEAAQARVESRDHLLQLRVKLMYTNGLVSYMDVLFQATSFSDFLDRYHALEMIVGQDKEILEANKLDRDLVESKKREVETRLAEIRAMYEQAADMKEQLVAQEQEKEKAVQILSKKEQEFEEISGQQEALLEELARKRSKLYAEKLSKQKGGAYSGGKLAWPLPGKFTITSGYGGRTDPFTKKASYHKGIDIGAPQGTTIVAADDGVVLIAEWVNGYGNAVVIDHGGGLWTWYGHIRNGGIKVNAGDSVKRGDKIAEVGSTGQATGPHLHFEVRKNETPVDPNPYLK